MTPRIYVQTGRLGDCIAFLPVLHSEFKNGQRCALLIAKEFSGVMDGVGYADKIEFDGPIWELDRAMAQAWQLSNNVKCVQLAGPAELVKQHAYQPAGQEVAMTDSFVKEAYKLAGHFQLWKTQPPLIFDRRDKARETELLKGFPPKKKVILVSAGGTTAPFPYRDLLFKLLKLNFEPKYVVVDLARFQAKYIFDLLALYERAHCLVACDSAPLHLAQAVLDLPVVALANDSPSLWHGAPWRANHISYIRYKDFSSRAVEMLEAIEGIGSFGSWKGATQNTTKIVHVWSQYDVVSDNIERHETAKLNWQERYSDEDNWIACKIDLRAVGKDCKTILKDERPFPPLKDVIRLGTFRAKDSDWILLTRADTCITPRIDFAWPAASDYKPFFARRTLRDDSGDTFHPVADMFCFTKAWWNEHGSKLPDLIMGTDPWWTRCLSQLILQNGGYELPMGTIYRARAKPSIMAQARAYADYNQRIGKEWLEANGGLALFPKVSEQVSAMRVNPAALFPGGYNPSIIRHNGALLMAYRYHATNNLSTQLAMAELDDKFNVVRNSRIEVGSNQQSAEDPRLFSYRGQLWLSWVDADFPSPAPTSVVKIGRLTQVGSAWNIEDIKQPQSGKNDGSGIEKNWLFWEHGTELVWIWKISNEQQVIHHGWKQEAICSTAPRWAYGEIRGGTTPLPYQGKLLRFFHSSLDFEQHPDYRRYFMGAAIMEAEPPFKTIAVSKSPIVAGSELDDLSDTERSQSLPYKRKVVFPAGAIIDGDSFIVSVGINDAQCSLLKLKESDLKF